MITDYTNALESYRLSVIFLKLVVLLNLNQSTK